MITEQTGSHAEAAWIHQAAAPFINGRPALLIDAQLSAELPDYFFARYEAQDHDTTDKLLAALGKSLCIDDRVIRERALVVVSLICERSHELRIDELRAPLVAILTNWLRQEKEFVSGFEFVCMQYQRCLLTMIDREQWEELLEPLAALEQVVSRRSLKSNIMTGTVARMWSRLAAPDVMERFFAHYCEQDDEGRLIFENLLLRLGTLAAIFLVRKLIASEIREERLHLLALIPKFGETCVPPVLESLADEPPWFVVRNMLAIINNLGTDDHYETVSSYSDYGDVRVQKEVLEYIKNSDESVRRSRLLAALGDLDAELAGQGVGILLAGEGELETGTAELPEDSEVYEALLAKIGTVLTEYPREQTLLELRRIGAERTIKFGPDDPVGRAAVASLAHIESEFVTPEQTSLPQAADNAAGPEQEEAGNAETAVAGRLLLVDRTRHAMTWSNLYKYMSDKEADEFYDALRPVSFAPGELLVRQGDMVTDLFFIDSGIAAVNRHDQSRVFTLNNLQSGELIGSEGFDLGISWSVSLSAQTELKCRILEQTTFLGLARKHPESMQKVRYDFNTLDVIPYLIYLAGNGGGGMGKAVDETVVIQADKLFSSTPGEQGDGILQTTHRQVARGGYCLRLEQSDEYTLSTLLRRQTISTIEMFDGAIRTCFGIVAGACAGGDMGAAADLYIKLYNPVEKADYRCTSLEIL